MTAYPDPWFGELPVPALKTRIDVGDNLKRYPRVAPGLGYFLTSPEWSQEPLEYRLCKDNPNCEPFWYVRQRYGGPSIHFIPRFGYPRSQESQIIDGIFSDYSHYYSLTDAHQIIERPVALVSAMKAISQRLRLNGEIVRAPNGKRAIACKNAVAAHLAGATLGSSAFHYSLTKTGRRTSR